MFNGIEQWRYYVRRVLSIDTFSITFALFGSRIVLLRYRR